jgi:BMFP domain-containing protein YqiC
MVVKRKNPQDLTLRNLRAMKTKLTKLEARVKKLESKLESKQTKVR